MYICNILSRQVYISHTMTGWDSLNLTINMYTCNILTQYVYM